MNILSSHSSDLVVDELIWINVLNYIDWLLNYAVLNLLLETIKFEFFRLFITEYCLQVWLNWIEWDALEQFRVDLLLHVTGEFNWFWLTKFCVLGEIRSETLISKFSHYVLLDFGGVNWFSIKKLFVFFEMIAVV